MNLLSLIICTQQAKIACHNQTNAMLSTENLQQSKYDEQSNQPNSCLCTNGGICVLSNDLCVCPKGFEGRYCEIDMNLNSATRELYSCGTLKHQHSEYRKCSLCQCSFGLLTCKVKWNVHCNSIRKRQLKSFKNRKLDYLQNLMTRMETLSYNEYLIQYAGNEDFPVRNFIDIDDDQQLANVFSVQEMKNTQNQLIVLKSNIHSNKILGIYFKTYWNDLITISNSSATFFDFNFLFLFCIFICYQLLAFSI